MQEVDDLISMIVWVNTYLRKTHGKIPRSVLKFYVYLVKYVKENKFKEKKFERLYKSCKADLIELVEKEKLVFDNETKEKEWFAKMDDLEEKILSYKKSPLKSWKLFNFLRKYKFSEEKILARYIRIGDKIMIVGPFAEYGRDPTLPVLLERLGNQGIIIIDIKGTFKDYHYGGQKRLNYSDNNGYGDLFLTKNTVDKRFNQYVKFVLSNALELSFKEKTFDVIIDRITHEFITGANEELLYRLIDEYNKILRIRGKIIFLSMHRTPKNIERILKNLGYLVHKGRVGKSTIASFHTTTYWIVGLKMR